MKKLIYILIAINIAFQLSAQTETDISKTAAASFEKLYNEGGYKAIFEMFTDQMKAALPLPKTEQFLSGLKSQAGAMKEREFLKYEKGSVATYKATFENGVLKFFLSTDDTGGINGMMMKEFIELSPSMERNVSKLILPFKGEWTIFWGGDTRELNYHVDYDQQKTAFDIVQTNEKNLSYKTDGRSNEDYYVFGQEIIAPAAGEVVQVIDGVKDNIPGQMNTLYVPGNTVIIKTIHDEYFFFAHFKQQSIVVKQGQKVAQGDLLGLCGNSGNSSEPHLHFQIQNIEDMSKSTGIKAYFDKIMVDGALKSDYSPIKAERVKNK